MADEEDPITRDDLAQSIRSARGEVDAQVGATTAKLVPLAIGGGVLLLIVAYLIGRRVGTTKSTVVEIRRI